MSLRWTARSHCCHQTDWRAYGLRLCKPTSSQQTVESAEKSLRRLKTKAFNTERQATKPSGKQICASSYVGKAVLAYVCLERCVEKCKYDTLINNAFWFMYKQARQVGSKNLVQTAELRIIGSAKAIVALSTLSTAISNKPKPVSQRRQSLAQSSVYAMLSTKIINITLNAY